MPDEGLLKTRDVARLLNLSPRQVRDMAAKREIPAIHVSSEWRFERSAIDRWVNRQRSGPGESEGT